MPIFPNDIIIINKPKLIKDDPSPQNRTFPKIDLDL